MRPPIDRRACHQINIALRGFPEEAGGPSMLSGIIQRETAEKHVRVDEHAHQAFLVDLDAAASIAFALSSRRGMALPRKPFSSKKSPRRFTTISAFSTSIRTHTLA
jgi:hypothetical protein